MSDDFFEDEVRPTQEQEIVLEITDEFEAASKLVNSTDDPLFVTGDAGTGKSTWLKWMLKNINKKAVVVAPTGIAAVNVRGQTIHSFFRWPPRPMTSADIRILDDNDIHREIDALIIDEISMVRADQIDLIDEFFQINRNDPRPFGGVQLIMIGDLLQLPPVSESMTELRLVERYGSDFFFAAKVWERVELKIIKFTKIFRQVDPVFIDILNKIRRGEITYAEIDKLNERTYTKEDEEKAAFLCARNDAVDKINRERIEKLPGVSHSYTMEKYGRNMNLASFIPEVLTLKIGAKIMMLMNDPLGRWQNGTIGHVVDCGRDMILVNIYGTDYWIQRHKWDSVKHKLRDGKILTDTDGHVEQFPLKVAYAISVHKSQGQTFDSVIIDFGAKAFAGGMAYVAISRSKRLDGVFFSTPLRKSDIYFDQKVLDFLKKGKYER